MNIRFLSLILFLNSGWCMFAGVDFKIINNAGMLLKLSYQVACQKSDLSLGYFEYDGQPVYIEPGNFDQIAEQGDCQVYNVNISKADPGSLATGSTSDEGLYVLDENQLEYSIEWLEQQKFDQDHLFGKAFSIYSR